MTASLAGIDPKAAQKLAAIVLAQRHLLPFVKYTKPNYQADRVHAYVARKLEAFEQAVREKRAPRLILFMPPQHGKSELISRKLPPWLLGRNPQWRIVLVSYGAELAEDMSEDARRVMQSDAYAEVFPESTLDPASKAVSDWRLERFDGGMRAVGVGGAITGRSAEVLIVDDPVKGQIEVERKQYRDEQWKWWPQARDRVQEGGGVIVLMTHWHHDDLAGRLIRAAQDNPAASQWDVVRLPALAEDNDPLGRAVGAPLSPGRYSLAALEALKADMPPREWEAKFQQRPTPDEGDLFNRAWFVIEPTPATPGPIFQYWDTAFGKRKQKGDYSVCGTWRLEPTGYRLLHVYRGRDPYPVLKQRAIDLAAAWKPRAVVIEDQASGQSIIQDLRNDTRLPVLVWRADGDKIARAQAITGIVASGRVKLPSDAAWMEAYLGELASFPQGEHDDQVDMTSMALAHMEIWNHRARNAVRTFNFAFTPTR